MSEPIHREGLNILVVDDEPGWRALFVWELESIGYEVTVADSGPDAIEKSKQKSFDVIVTDLTMEGMNGIETFLSIRKIQPDIKVILMTGYADENRVQEALSNKDTVCVIKPFELKVMVQTIRELSAR